MSRGTVFANGYDFCADPEYVPEARRSNRGRAIERYEWNRMVAILVKLTPLQREAIREAARRADVSLTGWCVAVLLGAATGRLVTADGGALQVMPRRPTSGYVRRKPTKVRSSP